MTKTNVMRILDREHIAYRTAEYEYNENDLSGIHAASEIGMPANCVFKTLVTQGDKTSTLVFCIPCDAELDLKKAAIVSGNKKLALIHVKELLPLTGYIRGGCSPIGMKKKYTAIFHDSALLETEIALSAGLRGVQIIVSPPDVISLLNAKCADVIK